MKSLFLPILLSFYSFSCSFLLGQDVLPPLDLDPSVDIIENKSLGGEGLFVGEIKIPISVHRDSLPSGVESLSVTIRGTSRKLLIDDLLPKTTQEDVYAGTVYIKKKQESVQGGADLQGSYEYYTIKGNAQLNLEFRKEKSKSVIEGNKLPPKVTISSSGLRDRSRAARFKFKQTERNELEKRHVISLLVKSDRPFSTEAFVVDYEAVGRNPHESVERGMLLIAKPSDAKLSDRDIDKMINVFKATEDKRLKIEELWNPGKKTAEDITRNSSGYDKEFQEALSKIPVVFPKENKAEPPASALLYNFSGWRQASIHLNTLKDLEKYSTTHPERYSTLKERIEDRIHITQGSAKRFYRVLEKLRAGK